MVSSRATSARSRAVGGAGGSMMGVAELEREGKGDWGKAVHAGTGGNADEA